MRNDSTTRNYVANIRSMNIHIPHDGLWHYPRTCGANWRGQYRFSNINLILAEIANIGSRTQD
jgi:hypothetical protein